MEKWKEEMEEYRKNNPDAGDDGEEDDSPKNKVCSVLWDVDALRLYGFVVPLA